MSETTRIVLLVLCPLLALGSLWGAWIEWHAPLRGRTPFQWSVLRMRAFSSSDAETVHTRLRTGPAAAVTFSLFMAWVVLQAARAGDSVAAWVIVVAAGVSLLVWVLVALFNRPRWAVPPELRREPGMVGYAKRRPEQPFRDPRVSPASESGSAAKPAAPAERPDH